MISVSQIFSYVVEAIDIIGPLILSGLLVLLYFKQYKIQKAKSEPSIEVSDHEGDEEDIIVFLSNYGGGVAKDIRVEIETNFGELGERYSVEVPLHRRSQDEGREKTRERAVGPQERGVKFSGRPAFPTPQTVYNDFATGISRSAQEGNLRIEFYLNLKYENQLGDERSEPIDYSGNFIYLNREGDEYVQSIKTREKRLNFEKAVERGEMLHPVKEI